MSDPTAWTVERCPACKAAVVWAIGVQNAAWMALDAEPHSAGSMVVEPGWDGNPRARKVSAKLAFGRRQLRVPHTTTCTRKDQLKLYHYSPPAAA